MMRGEQCALCETRHSDDKACIMPLSYKKGSVLLGINCIAVSDVLSAQRASCHDLIKGVADAGRMAVPQPQLAERSRDASYESQLRHLDSASRSGRDFKQRFEALLESLAEAN